MSDPTNEFDQARDSLLLFIWKKRILIFIVTAVAGLAALIVAFLITPQFKSTAIVFPAATSTVSFSEQRNAKASSMDFGEEEQAEQLIQILQSSRIRNRIVRQFDLMDHYEIDKDDDNKNYKLGKAWSNHILFKRTRYGSIQIDVLDKDRELAAKIANKIVQLIDTVKNEMVRERTIPAFEISQRKKDILEYKKDIILSQLDTLSKLGVLPIEGRARLFDAYNNSKNQTDRAFFKKQIDINIEYGAKFDGLQMLRDENIVKFSKFEDAYEQAESDANTFFNHKFVVERAVVADKKHKPKRLIIILLSSIGAFIFVIFALLIKDRISELKRKEG
jgi:uncharacterized protein involved in exopolysaccharide biosynthesis